MFALCVVKVRCWLCDTILEIKKFTHQYLNQSNSGIIDISQSQIFILRKSRPDHRLKALVYKLVPGLCQSEHKRQRAFNERHNIKPICAARNLPRSKSASHSVNDNFLERDNNGDWMKVVRLNADLADDEYSFWSADDPIR